MPGTVQRWTAVAQKVGLRLANGEVQYLRPGEAVPLFHGRGFDTVGSFVRSLWSGLIGGGWAIEAVEWELVTFTVAEIGDSKWVEISESFLQDPEDGLKLEAGVVTIGAALQDRATFQYPAEIYSHKLEILDFSRPVELRGSKVSEHSRTSQRRMSPKELLEFLDGTDGADETAHERRGFLPRLMAPTSVGGSTFKDARVFASKDPPVQLKALAGQNPWPGFDQQMESFVETRDTVWLALPPSAAGWALFQRDEVPSRPGASIERTACRFLG